MAEKTRKLIEEKIVEYTNEFCFGKVVKNDASAIAGQLYISRSLASNYLNEMYQKSKLLKINTRPVLFLDKKTIEKVFKIHLSECEFDCIEDLMELIDNKKVSKGSFIKACGYDGSLNYIINRMQSAVKYPPYGLPILLLGNIGVGKSFLAELLARYCIDEELADSSKVMKLYFNEVDSIQTVNRKLFGKYNSESKKIEGGLLSKCDNGFLILEDIQKCNDDTLKKLVDYFKKGYYKVEGCAQKLSAHCRIVLTSSYENSNQQWLEKEIPIVCSIPSLHERPYIERENIVVNQFIDEEKRIGKMILISNQVFYNLVHYEYQANIKELQAVIKSACSDAYDADNDKIIVNSHSLPNSFFFLENHRPFILDESNLIEIDQYNSEEYKEPTLVYMDILLSLFKSYQNNEIDESVFMEESFDRMNDYYNYIAFEKQFENIRIKSFENSLNHIVDYLFDQNQTVLPSSCVHVIAKAIYNYIYNRAVIDNWENENNDTLVSLKKYLQIRYFKSFKYAESFVDEIKMVFDIELDVPDLIFIFFNIHFYNRDFDELNYCCLIIAHGYSTASSIADSVNKMVGMHIYDSIDMPLNTGFDEILQRAEKYFNSIKNCYNFIILIDMGSLEQIDKLNVNKESINLGIIDNVNTKLALDIAMKVKSSISIDEIVTDNCCKNNLSSYKLYMRAKKENIILFTTEVGETASERIVRLFKNSIPKSCAINIMTYSYAKLKQNGNNDEIFKQKNVILIIGLTKSDNLDVPFMSLEDIVAFSDFDLITSTFSPYIDIEDMKIFNKNLVKNFSLSSIMDNVTILNASVLLEVIEKSLTKLEKNYNAVIPNKIKVGIYIHVSSLVERIVMKQTESSLPSVQENSQQFKKFSKIFSDSFNEVSEYYNIRFPNNEIFYLYNYLLKYIIENES
ncbi:MAG: sigma 54-interacting transcriptional regulator [Erysipelotrichia bacterium]|nr:sigma 54-interacting transcriptional regulator [Erysipelotrichia bacterium]